MQPDSRSCAKVARAQGCGVNVSNGVESGQNSSEN
jgi:hypothetical protein